MLSNITTQYSKQLILSKIKDNPKTISTVIKYFTLDLTFLLEAIKINVDVLKYLGEDVRNNKEFIREAVKINTKVLKYINKDIIYELFGSANVNNYCDDQNLIDEFNNEINHLLITLNQCNYYPTVFKGMITKYHGDVIRAVSALIGNPKLHDGLSTMIELEIPLTNSLEYFVYSNEKYKSLFSEEVIEVCRRKLIDLELIDAKY